MDSLNDDFVDDVIKRKRSDQGRLSVEINHYRKSLQEESQKSTIKKKRMPSYELQKSVDRLITSGKKSSNKKSFASQSRGEVSCETIKRKS